MAKILITIDSEKYTQEQLMNFLTIFAKATGWQEKTIVEKKDEKGNPVLGPTGLPEIEVDTNGDPVLEDNPVKPLEYVSIPTAAYFRQTILAYNSKQAELQAKKEIENQTNAALDDIKVSVSAA